MSASSSRVSVSSSSVESSTKTCTAPSLPRTIVNQYPPVALDSRDQASDSRVSTPDVFMPFSSSS